jgi:hypothetical protein
MRNVRWCVLAGIGGMVLVGIAGAPAAAELSEPCSAEGVFEASGVTVDPKATNGPIEIAVDLPPPLPDFTAGSWSEDDAVETTKTDTYTYDLPAFLPRGYEVTVSGFHNDATFGNCSGSVVLKVKGGFFASPTGPVAFVITALSAAGVVIAARPKVAAP